MLRLAAALGMSLFVATGALAQSQTEGISSTSGGTTSMGGLLAQGYEIKTSVLNGTKVIVFMQKDKTAYACEFVTLTRSRCGVIN